MSTSSTRPPARPDPISNRDLERWHRSSIRRIAVGFGSVGMVVLFGVLGYLSHGWTLFESLYMVVITISGVGFGEVRPLGSTSLQVHTMMVIGMGMVSVAYTLAGFVQLLTEG